MDLLLRLVLSRGMIFIHFTLFYAFYVETIDYNIYSWYVIGLVITLTSLELCYLYYENNLSELNG